MHFHPIPSVAYEKASPLLLLLLLAMIVRILGVATVFVAERGGDGACLPESL